MLATTLDPEDLSKFTQTYYDRCGRAIEQYDGVIASYLGDGIMALFGYPRAHEDDAERAVHAALNITELVKTLGAGEHPPLRVRVGVATGHVVVGEDKMHALVKEKAIVGEAPNKAAHLQAAAEPNSILISDATRQLIGDVFELKKLELSNPRQNKQRETAWRVVRSKAIASRFAAHTNTLTKFVGRTQEVALLMDRWQEAKQGEGQVILLAGDAGVGKSRIIDTFRKQVSDDAQALLHFQCSPYHIDSALFPVITELEHDAGFMPDDLPYVRLGKLEDLLKDGGADLTKTIPLIAALLSIPADDRYPPADLDPQRRKERSLGVLVDRLVAIANKSPLLIIVEDLHWADPTTLDFFSRAILRLREMRAMLIMSFRPDFRAPWTGHAHVTALLLSRLGRRYCLAMIEAVANGKTLPSAVTEQIIEKSDGVPLYVEELTKTVLESGLLQESDDSWTLIGPLPEFAIPATLQDSLLARLDRFPSVKEVAQLGAAIGREFSYNLLAAVSNMPGSDLQSALDKLAGAELIFSRGVPPAASYIFKHALVQDAAYETMLKSKRQQLHGRIAKALEDHFLEVKNTQPEILAHHYTQAGLTETAVAWWDKAGEHAIKRSANMEAVRHLGRAIKLLQSKCEFPERGARELAIRIKMSGPLIATGGYVTAELADNYARAWELCSKLGEDKAEFPVMYGQWVIPYVRGDMRAALENSERFLRRAEHQGDTGLLMMGHRIYGSSHVWRGNTLTGSEHLRHALSLYRTGEHDQLAYIFSQHPRTAALSHLCLALQHIGLLDQAMEAGDEAISEARRFQHFNSIAYSLCFVSLLIMLRRDTAKLKSTAGELLQLAEQYSAAYWALWAKPMLGWIAAQEGDIETGIRQMHESTEKLQKQKANLWVPQTLLLEAEILGKAAQYQRAYSLIDAAQALIEPLEQRFYEAELHRVRGAVLMAEQPGSLKASESLDRAIDVARRQNSRFLELRACVSKARLSRDRGMRAEARDILMGIYQSFSEGHDTADMMEARTLLDELA
jgi:class 3 adenylate cyclase/predicted ATPase